MDRGWENHLVESFTRCTVGSFASRQRYSQVHVLLLYWEKTDLKIQSEIAHIRRLFEKDFNFQTATYPIVNNADKQRRLHEQLLGIAYDYGSSESSLIIVYYGGHCRRDEQGTSVWAAYKEDGPIIPWPVIREPLNAANGDVLLVLDCCHAAQIRKESKPFGRYELLAACSKNESTPGPGPTSFTHALVKELRGKKSGVFVKDLCSILREVDTIRASDATPIFHDYVRKYPESVQLKRFEYPEQDTFMTKPTNYAYLRVAFASDPKGQELADWLKTGLPANVTAVKIDAVISRARLLQNHASDFRKIFPSGSVLDAIPEESKRAIIREFQKLDTTIVDSLVAAENATESDDPGGFQRVFGSIQNQVGSVCETVEVPLLSIPPEDLEDARQTTLAEITRADIAVSLRAILHMPLNSLESSIPLEAIEYRDVASRVAFGMLSDTHVVIEIYHYERNLADSNPYPETLQQLRKITALLRHPKRASFHTLPCVGFFHHRYKDLFGLVFEPPARALFENEPATLRELYRKDRYVALGSRICLANELLQAIFQFHKVGWVHKSLRSDNIFFFPAKIFPPCGGESGTEINVPTGVVCPVAGFDISKPLLFGFEYAREGDAGTKLDEDHSSDRNLYRHPQRWNNPSARFEVYHDIYALGVVLMEIAYWKDIRSILKQLTESNIRDSGLVKKSILSKCRHDLPFMVGQVFCDVILFCFGFGEEVRGMEMDPAAQMRHLARHMNQLRDAAVIGTV